MLRSSARLVGPINYRSDEAFTRSDRLHDPSARLRLPTTVGQTSQADRSGRL